MEEEKDESFLVHIGGRGHYASRLLKKLLGAGGGGGAVGCRKSCVAEADGRLVENVQTRQMELDVRIIFVTILCFCASDFVRVTLCVRSEHLIERLDF